ncbi:hypothetical protein CO058_04175 [candidate division WWE3 bacterium CG_4_9_14_0_2_um_filter_35_11]|uniref:ATP synthase subunit b n=1 Tax=candidate division WWE3 bacterium CG_4_9_14_0_2_um_filter_35_11 TaxID=1975077 RepID=A0A2M8EKR8_UNCKA|nr:MAG: hypothetical protein COV25_03390 [candidate division WWE3 bacterium CG10_big_fil_rev_8_21_14_0_10_35_32]PJC23333.1 MAG: hypothetical protein CO058_04175 [candidate division WWE3 bacterium CG_4_9_14_0_2_um_filter_35_11]
MSALENLGIDLTSISLYIVNFGIIVFFMNKYLTGPLIEMLEKRRSTIENNLNEAEKLREEMSKQKIQIDSEKTISEKKLQEQEANLNDKLQKKASEVLKLAEEKSAEIISNANEVSEKKKKEILSETEKEIKSTVKNMVMYIVSNKLPEDIIVESVDEAWQKSFQNKK